MLSFDDHILNHCLLKVCLEQYAKGLEGKEHPFLSPIDMHDKVLSEFPLTRIYTAGADPLRDDGYAFAARLLKL